LVGRAQLQSAVFDNQKPVVVVTCRLICLLTTAGLPTFMVRGIGVPALMTCQCGIKKLNPPGLLVD